MAKTKIDDLPKGTDEMDTEEQKAAKGGTVRLAEIKAAQIGAVVASSPDSGISAPLDLDASADSLKSKLEP